MFKKILVAIDDFAENRLVFEEALALAQKLEASLMLLHVLAPEERNPALSTALIPYYYPVVNEEAMRQYQAEWREAEDRGLQALKVLTDEAMMAGISTEFTQHIGDASRIICTLAKDWNADLIFVGRRGYSGLSEWLLGSVSNYVLHHAPCSVLVVQASTNPNSESANTEQTAMV